MCKIFLVAGIKPSTKDKVWQFAQAIAKPMSRVNSDGLGYGAITANGQLFGERWLNNEHAFKTKEEADSVDQNYAGAIEQKKIDYEYNSYGTIDLDNMVALTMHTRFATSPKGMNNVHPFVMDDISLIHNGMIRNHDEFKLVSTCDSEAILHAYIQQKVWESPNHFQAAADMLRGYYACGVLVNTDIGPFMDIFKAHGATLYVTYVKQLETYVHCTSDIDIKDTCKEFGYEHGPIYALLPSKFIRVDALTGKSISINGFTPGFEWGATSYQGHHNFQNHPTQNRTWMNSGNGSGTGGTETKQLPGKVTSSNILPYGKKKENTKISKEMIEYFKSGVQSCVKLSDHEIQEEIMNTERTLGRY